MSGNRQGQRLTTREREIVGALAEGETVTEIAHRLVLSRRTVEAHLHNAKGQARMPHAARRDVRVWPAVQERGVDAPLWPLRAC